MDFAWKTLFILACQVLPLCELHSEPVKETPSLPFHPICLEKFYAFFDEEPVLEVHCPKDAYHDHVDVSQNKAGQLSAFSEIEEGGYLRYTIYDVRFPRPGQETYIITASMNTGGSGVFGNLMLITKNTESKKIELLLSIPGGDRCNDGYLSDANLDEAKLYWKSAATPFRLLNPVDIRNERMIRMANVLLGEESVEEYSYFLGWKPYEDVSNSATSCAGSIVHEYDISSGDENIVGVEVSLGEGWGNWSRQSQGSQHKCLSKWRPTNANSIQTSMSYSLEEWQKQLNDIAEKCN